MTAGATMIDSLWAMAGLHGHGLADVLQLALHFMMLSLLAIGGAMTTAPDMQRYLVQDRGWLDADQFTSSIAIAQVAPGPNILFAALMGWTVAGMAGLVATLGGFLLPSSLTTLAVGRYGRSRADALALRAFTAGMVPLTLGLLLSSGWVLTAPTRHEWSTPLLVVGTVVVMVRTRLSPLWMIALGAIVGALFMR
mgnify:FL=1